MRSFFVNFFDAIKFDFHSFYQSKNDLLWVMFLVLAHDSTKPFGLFDISISAELDDEEITPTFSWECIHKAFILSKVLMNLKFD